MASRNILLELTDFYFIFFYLVLQFYRLVNRATNECNSMISWPCVYICVSIWVSVYIFCLFCLLVFLIVRARFRTLDESHVITPGYITHGHTWRQVLAPGTTEVRRGLLSLYCPSTRQERSGGRTDPPWPGMSSRETLPKGLAFNEAASHEIQRWWQQWLLMQLPKILLLIPWDLWAQSTEETLVSSKNKQITEKKAPVSFQPP